MSRKYAQFKKTTLAYGISDSDTTMSLVGLKKLDGTSPVAGDIGDFMTMTFDAGTSKEEICSITSADITINSDGSVDLVNVVRGLLEVSPYTTGGYASEHGAGATVVFSNNPQLYNQLANKSNDNTFTGQNIFSGHAPQTDTDPVSPDDVTRLSYVQTLILGTLTTINLILPGTAGETITAGQLVYLKTADNRWWLCDADTAATVDNVQLGIAQGAGTAGSAVLNGVMTQGVDTHQTGLTGGQTQYASNTAGGISSTPGTVEVTVGIAKSTTELMVAPRFNQQLTEDQQDALAGSLGTPSATNRFVTEKMLTTVVTLSAQAIDGTLGSIFTRTLAANETFTQSGFTAGRCFMVEVKQGAGTSYTATWFSGITWITSGATAPTQTTTTNGTTTYGFRCTGTNTFLGYLVASQ